MTPHFPNEFFHNRLTSAMPLELNDLLPQTQWNADTHTSAGFGEEPQRPQSGVSEGVYVPEHYEPGYAYPLIVWLADTDAQSDELLERMPEVSDRNFLACAFSLQQFENAPDATEITSDCLEQLGEHLVQMRRDYHIHSERICLAGFGSGAVAAVSCLLRRPQWFSGAMAFDPRFPEKHTARTHFRELADKRVLIGIGPGESKEALGAAVRSGRLMHSAGMDVCTRIYDSPPVASAQALGDINRWMMEGVFESNLV